MCEKMAGSSSSINILPSARQALSMIVVIMPMVWIRLSISSEGRSVERVGASLDGWEGIVKVVGGMNFVVGSRLLLRCGGLSFSLM